MGKEEILCFFLCNINSFLVFELFLNNARAKKTNWWNFLKQFNYLKEIFAFYCCDSSWIWNLKKHFFSRFRLLLTTYVLAFEKMHWSRKSGFQTWNFKLLERINNRWSLSRKCIFLFALHWCLSCTLGFLFCCTFSVVWLTRRLLKVMHIAMKTFSNNILRRNEVMTTSETNQFIILRRLANQNLSFFSQWNFIAMHEKRKK